MAVLTSTRDQNRVAAAARKVGGYSALVRLSKQRHTVGAGAVLKRDPRTGEWSYCKPD
jgi:hypothetical protein